MSPVDSLMTAALADGVFPGGVLLVAKNDAILFNKAFGYANIYTQKAMTRDTCFDLASLTKPLATTLDECEAMLAAAREAGVFLMVDWHNRWNPPIYQAWKSIQTGELGQVRYIYYRLSDTLYVPLKMLPWAEQSSVMWFLGSHALDTVCWLLGKKPVKVYCQKSQRVLADLGVNTPDL